MTPESYNSNFSTLPQPEEPLEFEDARKIVIEAVTALQTDRATETVALEDAHGRILAADVMADRDYPALRRSLRDGFAIRAESVPGVLRIRGEVRAGEEQTEPLGAGEAIEIMTGAPVPDDADAVVMVEHVQRREGNDGTLQVQIDRTAEPGQWINPRGTEAASGATLIPKATKLDAGHIATLAMIGKAAVEVFVRPSIAILATGDEIVPLETEPAMHQIRNSNSYLLAALVKACGGEPVVLPIARDTADALRPLLQQGLTHDMLIVTGGVSAGRYDLVKPGLRSLGAEFRFERVRIQPGGPCAFGIAGGKPVFGLPGNPGSTYVTFQLFAEAAVAVLAGNKDPHLPLLIAKFSAPFKHRIGLTRFLPACLSGDGEHLTHIPWQGSSDVPALAKANAFLVADYDRDFWSAGDSIRVMTKI